MWELVVLFTSNDKPFVYIIFGLSLAKYAYTFEYPWRGVVVLRCVVLCTNVDERKLFGVNARFEEVG